jgi:hypothetical protein
MLSILAALALLGGIGVSSPATAPAYEVAHVSASKQVVAAVEPFPNYDTSWSGGAATWGP